MSIFKVQMRGWKLGVLISLLIFGGTWGGLKWAEKAFARFYYESEKCDGQYIIRHYFAFSLWDVALYLVPIGIGDREHPSFIRVIEKKTGRLIGETGVYWIMSAPKTFCPEFGEPDEISFFYGGYIDALETFKVSPP